jgi:ankyrin repeat protein
MTEKPLISYDVGQKTRTIGNALPTILSRSLVYAALLIACLLFGSIGQAQVKDHRLDSDLFNAVWRKNRARVQELLLQGADPNYSNGLLILTSIRNATDSEILELLLQHGGKPNNSCKYGGWPFLAWAVTNGDVRKVSSLLEAKADPDFFAGNHHLSPYHVTLIENEFPMIELLRSYGASLTPILKNEHVSFDFGRQIDDILEIRQTLIKNYHYDSTPFWNRQITTQEIERRLAGTLILTKLLDESAMKSVAPNQRQKQLQDNLTRSLNSVDVEMAELFLSLGAHLDASQTILLNRDFFFSGQTQEEKIRLAEFSKLLDFLAARGLSVDITSGGDYSKKATLLLQLTELRAGSSLVEMLVKRGATVTATDKDGNTPLHHAAHHCNTAHIKLLLTAGAEPNAKNRAGETPMDKVLSAIQIDSARSEARKLLEENGAHTAFHVGSLSLTYPVVVFIIASVCGLFALGLSVKGKPGNAWSAAGVSLAGFSWWAYISTSRYAFPYGISMGLDRFLVLYGFSLIATIIGWNHKENSLRGVGCLLVFLPFLFAVILPILLLVIFVLAGGSMRQ